MYVYLLHNNFSMYDIIMYSKLKELYPICRSITGNGVRETLQIIKKDIPIQIHEIESGKEVFDWTIPDEWNINDAYVKNSKGEKVIDFQKNNLHVVSYSCPFVGKMTLNELKEKIHTLDHLPDSIPYLTTYYKRDWGFCMKHNDFLELGDDVYEIVIDTTLEPGNLTYADLIIPGKSDKEILISSYICHPSIANDCLSGTVLSMHLAKYLLEKENYYTYRFVFIPECIGAIAYINKNFDILKKNVVGGYVITCVGDDGDFTYLKTRKENQLIDKVTLYTLKKIGCKFSTREFYLAGSDERQYNYPGVDLNIGSLMRTKYGEFDEYHTSKDDLDFISQKDMELSLSVYKECICTLETNQKYINTVLCEPRLGKYGLYSQVGGLNPSYGQLDNIRRRMLYYFDGEHDLIDISVILNVPCEILEQEVVKLKKANLIRIQ
jgi:aminopeptidase-like protein